MALAKREKLSANVDVELRVDSSRFDEELALVSEKMGKALLKGLEKEAANIMRVSGEMPGWQKARLERVARGEEWDASYFTSTGPPEWAKSDGLTFPNAARQERLRSVNMASTWQEPPRLATEEETATEVDKALEKLASAGYVVDADSWMQAAKVRKRIKPPRKEKKLELDTEAPIRHFDFKE